MESRNASYRAGRKWSQTDHVANSPSRKSPQIDQVAKRLRHPEKLLWVEHPGSCQNASYGRKLTKLQPHQVANAPALYAERSIVTLRNVKKLGGASYQ